MILDTCFVIDIMREANNGEVGSATQALNRHHQSKLKLSIFSLCELRAGALRTRSPGKELAKLEALTDFMEIVYPSSGFAVVYGESHERLRRSGNMIPLMDLLIAVLAMCESQPILTRDASYFKRIPGLVVESY